MSAFHVVVRQRSSSAPSATLAPLYGLFDVVVDGVNITARIGESEAPALLAELGQAVARLAAGLRDRAAVQLYADDEAWELGLELDTSDVLVSVYRLGAFPEVAVHERRVAFEALRSGVIRALEEVRGERLPRSVQAALAGARAALAHAPGPVRGRPLVRTPVEILSCPSEAIRIIAQGSLRRATADGHGAGGGCLERADLHSLLVRGPCLVESRGRATRLGDLHLFLLAEQLLLLADDVLSAWQHARPVFRRIACGEVKIGVRRGPGDAFVAFTVASPTMKADRSSVTIPEIEPAEFVRVATSFARALADALCESDPSQRSNLRVGALRRLVDTLEERVAELLDDQSRPNPAAESYRAFAPRPRSTKPGQWAQGSKMRFVPRWVATIPNIDLRATFLCGEQLIVGGDRETASIQRRTGDIVWQKPTPRATSVVTPAGLVRIQPDGRTTLHDLENGEPRFSVTLEPRNGGAPTGAVVHTPGLPKLLVVSEGDRKITALDLISGEVRWRHTARHPLAPRMRRAGRLLVVADGDSALLALDVTTGEVVWLVRNRPPFTGELVLDNDSVFALTGSRGAASGLVHVDPWSGALRWRAELPDRHAPGQAPLLTPNRVVVPCRDSRGSGAHAFDRESGELVWSQPPGLCSPTTSWLAVDDGVVANSAAGSFVCLDAHTGLPRYSHVFSRHVVADQPRRLEPVLRSGALFVPQHQVHVVRPRDGELLGTVPTDLIPDLLRVDEHCDVYVVEESGHVAAFGAAPKLTLVR